MQALQCVDLLHHQKNDQCKDDGIDRHGEKVTVCEQRDAGLGKRFISHRSTVARWRRTQHEVPVGEVQAPNDAPDDRHDEVLDQRIDDLAECRADDDADGKVDDAALDRKFTELAHERHVTLLTAAQTAASPDSPVRMRTTCSTLVTNILPSPIFPVRAALTTASMARSTNASPRITSTLTLGRKSTTYSAPRYNSVCPFWRPNPFTSVTVRPVTPSSDNASRTSSSLNGLMIASTFFIATLLVPRACPAPTGRGALGDYTSRRRSSTRPTPT